MSFVLFFLNKLVLAASAPFAIIVVFFRLVLSLTSCLRRNGVSYDVRRSVSSCNVTVSIVLVIPHIRTFLDLILPDLSLRSSGVQHVVRFFPVGK